MQIAPTPLIQRTRDSPSPRASMRLCAWWQRIRHRTHSRYSIAKAKRFLTYAHTASTLRQIITVGLFAGPGLLPVIVASLIPLQHPMDGITANWGIIAHFGLLNCVPMIGGMMQARAASRLDHGEYSTALIVTIATVAALHAVGFFVAFSYWYRFPMPFYAWIAPWPFFASLVWAHYICTLVGRFPNDVRAKLVQYLPPLALQVAQLPLYTCYSVLFAAANEWQQLSLVLLFPCIKALLYFAIRALSRNFDDFTDEIAVCGVEISASLYQAMIMQSTPSMLVTASIIGVDLLVCVVEIKRCLDRKTSTPTHEILERATKILEASSISVQELPGCTDMRKFRTSGSKPVTRVAVASRQTQDNASSVPENDKLLLAEALELLQAAESILLVEFLEVSIPLMNACVLVVASQLPSARYSRALRPFHTDPSRLGPALTSILLYVGLEAATLVGMCVALRARFRLPAMKLLAFVLEEHRWSLQGKLIMWLPVMFSIPIIHYGVDFTFRFDFTG